MAQMAIAAILGDTGRYRAISGDTGRYRAIQGETDRQVTGIDAFVQSG